LQTLLHVDTQHTKCTDCVHLLQSCGLVQIFEALFCIKVLKLTWHRIAPLQYSFQLRLTFIQAEFVAHVFVTQSMKTLKQAALPLEPLLLLTL